MKSNMNAEYEYPIPVCQRKAKKPVVSDMGGSGAKNSYDGIVFSSMGTLVKNAMVVH